MQKSFNKQQLNVRDPTNQRTTGKKGEAKDNVSKKISLLNIFKIFHTKLKTGRQKETQTNEFSKFLLTCKIVEENLFPSLMSESPPFLSRYQQ